MITAVWKKNDIFVLFSMQEYLFSHCCLCKDVMLSESIMKFCIAFLTKNVKS